MSRLLKCLKFFLQDECNIVQPFYNLGYKTRHPLGQGCLTGSLQDACSLQRVKLQPLGQVLWLGVGGEGAGGSRGTCRLCAASLVQYKLLITWQGSGGGCMAGLCHTLYLHMQEGCVMITSAYQGHRGFIAQWGQCGAGEAHVVHQ